MKWVTTILVLVVTVGAITGRRLRRGYDNSEYVNGKIDRESDEQDASGSGEIVGECGGVAKGAAPRYDNPEVAYNRDGRAPAEEHRGNAGHAFSKASASASATSSTYNMNHKTNVIPA